MAGPRGVRGVQNNIVIRPPAAASATAVKGAIEEALKRSAEIDAHRIRVDVTSSNFPQFDRNLNTGDPLGKGTQPRVAQQTIHHSASKPSAIILPVVKGF